MRALVITGFIVVVTGLGWLVDLPLRVANVAYQFQHHLMPGYAAAFLFAPRSELRPAAWITNCTTECIEFEVDSGDAAALDATLVQPNGLTTHPIVDSKLARLRFDLAPTKPTDVWLTWKPQVFDPGYGISPPPCGQALSMIGVRPTRLDGGRVGVQLKLTPRRDRLEVALMGDQPYVP